MNPFALPVHPAVVHFPIALVTVAWACLVARYATGRPVWSQRAWLYEVVGVPLLPVAIVAALIDTRGLRFLAPARWDGPLVWHAMAGTGATLVLGTHLYLWWRRGRSAAASPLADLVLFTTGLWLVVVAGLIGAEMVYAA